MKEVEIYSDGACSYNPGPGGWATVLLYGDSKREIAGGEVSTTNNRMEMTAVIKGLEALKENCSVKVYSDSAYIVNAFNQKWLDKWQKNGWKTSSKQPVENQDLWLKLLDLTSFHQVTFIKVKGHSNNVLNNRCDELARAEVIKITSGTEKEHDDARRA